MATQKTARGRETTRPSPSRLRAVHELFVAGEVDATYLNSNSVRPVVAQSWQRSLAGGVDPDLGGARASAAGTAIDRLRETHPLAPAMPVIRRLLVDDAADSGVVVAVSRADGTLLWVEGDPSACRKAEAMNFVPGADWSERSAGTNAPGTALALDRELQIRGSEHFSRVVQPWSCTAAPVHDPTTGALLGAIDLTGGTRGGRHRRRWRWCARRRGRREPSCAAAVGGPRRPYPPGSQATVWPCWAVTDRAG